jgi:hypothetical protein
VEIRQELPSGPRYTFENISSVRPRPNPSPQSNAPGTPVAGVHGHSFIPSLSSPRTHRKMTPMTGRPFIFAALLLASASLLAQAPAPVPVHDKARLFVLTDIANEPDDQESLVRLLAYANEFDIEGLVATTSTFLRGATREDQIRKGVEAYGQVQKNLAVHAPGYPSAESLLAVVAGGQTAFGVAGVGGGKASAGSKLLIAAADRADARPLWVTAWGGSNTLAQALSDVRATRTPEQLAAFVAKLRVYTISD